MSAVCHLLGAHCDDERPQHTVHARAERVGCDWVWVLAPRTTAMASSQGDVGSSFPDGMVLPSGADAAKTPATSAARDADYLLDADYLFGQNMTEHNPAPSPYGHPLLRRGFPVFDR